MIVDVATPLNGDNVRNRGHDDGIACGAERGRKEIEDRSPRFVALRLDVRP
ncbi:hypothetical protein ACVWWR_005581 [Bradyrhizobium sp. LM3.2]